jgi:flagellar hook-length control protein FliK
VKATAPQALVSPGKKNGTPQGAKGLPAALALSAGKGKASFLSLMAARAAATTRTPQALPASLDKTRLLMLKAAAVAAAESDGRKNRLPGATASHVVQQQAAAQGPSDKNDPRRKTAQVHAADIMPAELFAAGPSTRTGGLKSADPIRTDAAAQTTAGPSAAKTVTARHAEPIVRIVDLRSRIKPDEEPATRSNASPSAADKDTSASFAQRLAGMRDIPADSPQKAAPSMAPAAQTTLERLQDMTGSELLHATNLVLKDGGGEIRLVLKPDSLGSVRVRMNLVDNVIEGKIIVDSSAVKQVVDGSIDALRRALTAEGFQMGSLQVSVGGQNADTGDRQEQEQQPPAIRRIAAQGFDRSIPGVENLSLGDLLVNVFV